MHATHCLVGCILCLASISGAATTAGGESQDVGNSAHAVTGSNTHSNGATPGYTADSTATDSTATGDQASTPADPSNPLPGSEDPGNPDAGPLHRAHAHQVGWQSLLPGSIQ